MGRRRECVRHSEEELALRALVRPSKASMEGLRSISSSGGKESMEGTGESFADIVSSSASPTQDSKACAREEER